MNEFREITGQKCTSWPNISSNIATFCAPVCSGLEEDCAGFLLPKLRRQQEMGQNLDRVIMCKTTFASSFHVS